MEAQTQLQDYLEQGKQALAQGQGRESAIAYAHGAQLEPDNPQVHLGLAEANLALGNYNVVQMAARRVQELQPDGGLEGWMAQALLDLLDKRYERSLQSVNKAIEIEPSIGYLHALRAYLLRATGQDYDASLARGRATRLSYGGRFENCFPPLETSRPAPYSVHTFPSQEQPVEQQQQQQQTQDRRDPTPSWSQPNPLRRQMVRTRFTLSQYPTLITNILIVINVIIFALQQVSDQVTNIGEQNNNLILQGEYWRLFTAMFLHASILHIAVNMFSLYMVGRAVEVFYGKWRYLVIYLLSGLAGGLAFLFFTPGGAALGASGAIFGVFGAVGVFYVVNRRALGAYGTGAIGQWIFIILLNLVFDVMPNSGIALWDHVGGLVMGIILAYLLIPRTHRGRMYR